MAERYYDRQRLLLALIPLAMRLAGPKEALWHALIRRNYGANHLIVGRDHASPGSDSSGRPFYEPYAAQDLVKQFSQEIGVSVIHFDEMVYAYARFVREGFQSSARPELYLTLSGTKVRENISTWDVPCPDGLRGPKLRNC
jgi:sulfate adenylyltransferase